MREILFRGKRKDNGEWIYGFYMNKDVKDIIVDTTRGSLGFGLEVDGETVGQYTGLCDKNGNKIFEGDIVKQDGSTPQVIVWGALDYEDDIDNVMIGTFICKDGQGENYYISKYDEVIGNIHDNPELLEVEL